MKDRYEISLWDDYLVPASGDIPAHYEEKKICVIGSDKMTASYRAYNPVLKSELNGTHTLTFKMYYTIKEKEITVDDTTFTVDKWGEFLVNGHTSDEVRTPSYSSFDFKATQNPFLNLLVNERKVKCYWKGEWYDFVIKNCQESSTGNSITYTCTDVFINELSKNGFEITLDTELENNTGTIIELANTVLDGTDWQLDSGTSDIVQQTKEEPVYEFNTLRSWGVTDQTEQQASTIPASSKILIFYQQVQDILNYLTSTGFASKNDEIQFAYAATYEKETNSQLVNNAHCYSDLVKWTKEQYQGVDCLTITPTNDTSNPYIRIFYHSSVSGNYRAARLVKQPISRLDVLTGKYCNVYIARADGTGQWAGAFSQGDEIYKYQSTEWDDALVVNNLVVNGKDFISNENWLGDNNLTFQLYPSYATTSDIATYTAKSYLHLSSGVNFWNGGIRQSSNYIPNGLTIGETYIFRYKAMSNSGSAPSGSYVSTGITPLVCTYKDEGALKVIDPQGPTYFSSSLIGVTDNWVEWRMTCIKSVTRVDIYQNKVALFLQTGANLWLEEAQMFKEVHGAGGVRINPGDIDVQSVSAVKYIYFNHTRTQSLTSATDITYLWSSVSDWDNASILDLQYNENFEKIRTVNAKRSNRFNLLQTLAQTFECWAQFIINHDSTGRTIYNSDGTPQKYVRFKNEIGQQTGIGFIYGIDLKGINRTIQSDKIVTKTIVTQNNNEFGTNGFCTIARSTENYPRSNFLLNFDYYISQGLLNGGSINNDLYDSTGDIGYYYWLHKYNIEYDEVAELLGAKRTELAKQLSYQTVYDDSITSLQESISNLQADLMNLAGVSTWSAATTWIKQNAEQDSVKSKMIAIKTQEESLASYQTMKTNLDNSITALQNVIEEKEEFQENHLELIKALDLRFYKKYSRFIQEGTWISEDYIDDNLYYLDAQAVAYTSSRPQVSYDISVIRISNLPEFQNKIFHLGDIAFVQDTEFFGYTYVNGLKTPYKEKVLISEVTSNFDQPELDSFKVQNYKTQFEDLFQRITSTTQSLQYSEGEYARAASMVEPTGTLNPETLQNSIALNEQIVYSAQNEAIVTDSTGITVTDTSNPNRKTKITSGGIFISTDGGTTWKNAVRGEGIATQYLTTGAINTNNISIMDGNFTAFRWDDSGINAYYKLSGDSGINLSKFIRFDHFGIYGLDNPDLAGAYRPTSEEQIWNDAKFGMTWKGFFLKNKYETHSLEVSSTDDIRVMRENTELIKIGKLDPNNNVFGIRIRDTSGQAVMETDTSGALWLKDRLNIYATGGTYNIGIGYLNPVTGETKRRVFDANNKFIVYEDGSMKATDGNFTGEIHATSGTIGNMTIDTANAIEAAVDNSRLKFDENGLTITNGGLAIYDGDTPVLYYDGTALHVTGTGTFSGAIYASEGSFTGAVTTDELTATGGTIGGFDIDANGIYSTDSAVNPSLRLLSNGNVYAKNLTLGVGATIEDYIRLGDNVYIWNPETLDSGGNVLEVRDSNNDDVISLDDTGNLTVGDIELRGASSEIWGDSFSITPSLATFTNINVTGTISTAVFTKGHVQSVGGIMMFKPSYKIESRSGSTLTLDQDFMGAVDDYVYVIKEDGTPVPGIIQIDTISNNVVTLSGLDYNGTIVSLIDIGEEDDLVIGVNSTNVTTAYLKPRGFSISEFVLGQTDPEDPTTKYIDENNNPKVFFGDLDTSGIRFADQAPKTRGFGLYSENVFLTGTITTDLSSGKFAGIDTLNGATATQISGDTSRIVFWAGATDTTTERVRLAPFQVTENGSIYARRGIFTDAILTDSSIHGADIYAARIHGTGKSESPVKDYGLAFYDTTDGIVFFEGAYGGLTTPTEVFSIGNNGLKKGSNYFIKVGSGIDFEGNNYFTKAAQNETQYIRLNTNYIAGAHLDGEGDEVLDNRITFDETNGIDFSFLTNDSIMNIKQGKITMSTTDVQIDNTFLLANHLQYKKVNNGYDLFVLG